MQFGVGQIFNGSSYQKLYGQKGLLACPYRFPCQSIHHLSVPVQTFTTKPTIWRVSDITIKSTWRFEQRRYLASENPEKLGGNKKRSRTSGTFQKLDSLPFSISPEEALKSFRHWADNEQGIKLLLLDSSIKIGASYVPVWSFDVNFRFRSIEPTRQTDTFSDTKLSSTKLETSTVQSNNHWKPRLFSVYKTKNSILHIPGLASYAGYSYRRSLINPVHSTTLVFLGHRTEPFGAWMLRDMKLQSTGQTIPVVPDAWNATKGRAFAIIREEMEGIAQKDWNAANRPGTVDVETQVLSSQRVLMPTYVIDYKIAGLEYRAFVSGCDKGAPVSGVSHKMFGDMFDPNELAQSSQHLLVRLTEYPMKMIPKEVVFFLKPIVQLLSFVKWLWLPVLNVLGFVVLRAWATIPILGVAGGVLAGFRKVLQPWMDNRTASAEWERQREHESLMEEEELSQEYRMEDFIDVGGEARDYFIRHRVEILNHLGGTHNHQEGGFDWYSDWQEWARKQRDQDASKTVDMSLAPETRHQEFLWDFDSNDPYAVLGIDPGASEEEVSAAFRTNMLKYHPDTQPNVSDAERARALERSKLITDAYRKIKTEMKD